MFPGQMFDDGGLGDVFRETCPRKQRAQLEARLRVLHDYTGEGAQEGTVMTTLSAMAQSINNMDFSVGGERSEKQTLYGTCGGVSGAVHVLKVGMEAARSGTFLACTLHATKFMLLQCLQMVSQPLPAWWTDMLSEFGFFAEFMSCEALSIYVRRPILRFCAQVIEVTAQRVILKDWARWGSAVRAVCEAHMKHFAAATAKSIKASFDATNDFGAMMALDVDNHSDGAQGEPHVLFSAKVAKTSSEFFTAMHHLILSAAATARERLEMFGWYIADHLAAPVFLAAPGAALAGFAQFFDTENPLSMLLVAYSLARLGTNEQAPPEMFVDGGLLDRANPALSAWTTWRKDVYRGRKGAHAVLRRLTVADRDGVLGKAYSGLMRKCPSVKAVVGSIYTGQEKARMFDASHADAIADEAVFTMSAFLNGASFLLHPDYGMGGGAMCEYLHGTLKQCEKVAALMKSDEPYFTAPPQHTDAVGTPFTPPNYEDERDFAAAAGIQTTVATVRLMFFLNVYGVYERSPTLGRIPKGVFLELVMPFLGTCCRRDVAGETVSKAASLIAASRARGGATFKKDDYFYALGIYTHALRLGSVTLAAMHILGTPRDDRAAVRLDCALLINNRAECHLRAGRGDLALHEAGAVLKMSGLHNEAVAGKAAARKKRAEEMIAKSAARVGIDKKKAADAADAKKEKLQTLLGRAGKDAWWKGADHKCGYCLETHEIARSCHCKIEKERKGMIFEQEFHDGELQLMTWLMEEEKDVGQLRLFRTVCEGKEDVYFKHPKGTHEYFRWTCCRQTWGEGKNGCDHHGTGSTPCSCDFCRAGLPVPEKFRHPDAPAAKHLEMRLSWGPDPRSKTAAGVMNLQMRQAVMGSSGGEDCLVM